MKLPAGVTVQAIEGGEEVLTPDALAFVADLQRRFGPTRAKLLEARVARQRTFDEGARPDLLPETKAVREGDWQVGPAPKDLDDRRVEITGPVDRKMMINALNSGANVFMADLEDSLSPTWSNVVLGQQNLIDAVRRTISIAADGKGGKAYALGPKLATLLVRPRGWHLPERHLTVDGQPVSASLCDFGLYFFHNAEELLARGTGPYFYLPKLEGHLEARLWNDVFVHAQQVLGIPRGTIRATVLIETILGAFEMEEILHELKEHAAGLNAGRWDYIFSIVKKQGRRPDAVLPDRAQVTMAAPFMRAYAERLVQVCHRRGAHAIGGMAAFIPSRKDPEVNARALAKVREDKTREAGQGYDGTWVAHPDLVPVAREAFDAKLGSRPHQKHVTRDDLRFDPEQLLDLRLDAKVTLQGVRTNIDVALQYLDQWLAGNGAAAIYNLMEDAATAEISRAQLWQWLRHGVATADGPKVDRAIYTKIRDEELARLRGAQGERRFAEAGELLDRLVLAESFEPFLTTLAYERLD
jgi:malate synthase